jgi:hypothetical protein
MGRGQLRYNYPSRKEVGKFCSSRTLQLDFIVVGKKKLAHPAMLKGK